MTSHESAQMVGLDHWPRIFLVARGDGRWSTQQPGTESGGAGVPVPRTTRLKCHEVLGPGVAAVSVLIMSLTGVVMTAPDSRRWLFQLSDPAKPNG